MTPDVTEQQKNLLILLFMNPKDAKKLSATERAAKVKELNTPERLAGIKQFMVLSQETQASIKESNAKLGVAEKTLEDKQNENIAVYKEAATQLDEKRKEQIKQVYARQLAENESLQAELEEAKRAEKNDVELQTIINRHLEENKDTVDDALHEETNAFEDERLAQWDKLNDDRIAVAKQKIELYQNKIKDYEATNKTLGEKNQTLKAENKLLVKKLEPQVSLLKKLEDLEEKRKEAHENTKEARKRYDEAESPNDIKVFGNRHREAVRKEVEIVMQQNKLMAEYKLEKLEQAKQKLDPNSPDYDNQIQQIDQQIKQQQAYIEPKTDYERNAALKTNHAEYKEELEADIALTTGKIVENEMAIKANEHAIQSNQQEITRLGKKIEDNKAVISQAERNKNNIQAYRDHRNAGKVDRKAQSFSDSIKNSMRSAVKNQLLESAKQLDMLTFGMFKFQDKVHDIKALQKQPTREQSAKSIKDLLWKGTDNFKGQQKLGSEARNEVVDDLTSKYSARLDNDNKSSSTPKPSSSPAA